MASRLAHRENLLHRKADRWRPPLFTPTITSRQRLLAFVRRLLDLQAASLWDDLRDEMQNVKGVVVDVGCGAQPYRGLLPPNVEYVGIDTIDAETGFGYRTEGTRYYAGDTWPVETGSVDVVLCSETLEHVADTARFLDEMHRCLRPGGRVVLTVPFAARWHFIPHDYWRFTPSGLHRVLTRAGFEHIAVYARGNALTVACYKQMALILPLLAPQTTKPLFRIGRNLVGALGIPWLALMAVIGRASLRWGAGDDCLGYTVVADRDRRSRL